MNKIKYLVFLLVISLCCPLLTFAESIVLKSGKAVEGKLIEKTDKYIKIDFQGVPLTYFFDEIENIDGQKLSSSTKENISGIKEAVPTGPSNSDYLKFKRKYYLLDEQNFTSITCKLKVSTLENLMGQIRQQMANLGSVELIDNLADFSLTYTKGKGLEFKKPYLDIRVISDKEIKDKELFNTGVEQMKNGFKDSIEGTIGLIQSIFDEFMTPEMAQDKIISFIDSGEAVKVSLEDKEGTRYDEVYKGNLRHTEFKYSQAEGESDDEFENMEGHLMFVKSDSKMNLMQGLQTDKGKLGIEYKKIKNLFFPSRIISSMNQKQGDLQMGGRIEITLEECTVN